MLFASKARYPFQEAAYIRRARNIVLGRRVLAFADSNGDGVVERQIGPFLIAAQINRQNFKGGQTT